MDGETWRRELGREREEKDRFLAEHDQSPLPEPERERFDGLPYYPPDPRLRFELPLHEHEGKVTVGVGTTDDGEREYLRWGEFRFEAGGEECTLQAYRSDREDPSLWVPFRDETNGEGTYAGGRYLDLDDDDRAGEDWVLDFNRAYNPFCVFSEEHECPMVPAENWLYVRIEAGEKLPDLAGGDRADS